MKKEVEYCFWIFDLKYDLKFKKPLKNTKWQKAKNYIYFQAYLLQIAGAFIHVFAIGEFSSHFNGQFVLKVAFFAAIAVLGFLNAVALIKIFTVLRKSSSILTFHEKEDEFGERHLQEIKHDRFGQESKNDKNIHENLDYEHQQGSNPIHTRNNESIVAHNNKEDANHNSINNRASNIYHKRTSIVRRSILGGQAGNLSLNVHSKIYSQINNFNQNKESLSSLNLLKFIGLFNVLLILCLGHLLSIIAMVIKVPPYYTHRILFSLYIFQAIPNGIFTTIVGFNIIFNIIFDTPYLKNLLKFKELQYYFKQLAKCSGYFFLQLVAIASLFGSIVTLTTENNLDIASIFLIVLFSLYYTYQLFIFLNRKYF
ncbi:hypothetical protein ABPG74_010181 [Tetrahymena malaccensis]